MTTPGGARFARVEPWAVAAVAVVAVVLLFARAPFAARQFWAEDGRDFFGDALRYGAVRSLGHSQAGYYLTVSRLGGVIASVVPIGAAAFALWAWVAAVTAWLVATVASSSRTWLATWPARVTVALALVLLPVLGAESIANAANLQFLLLFAALVVLISRPRGRLESVNGVVVLVATGLTTPVALLLVPFVALRMLRRRSVRPDPLVTGWLVGVGVQLLALAITRPAGRARNGDSLATVLDNLERSGMRLNLVPADLHQLTGPIVVVLFAAATAVVAGLAWRRGQRERALMLVGVPAFGVAVFAVLGSLSGAANRYLVVVGLCAVWAVMAGAETVADSLPVSWGVAPWIVSGAVALVLLVSFGARWTPSESRRSGPSWATSVAAARAACRADPSGRVRLHFAPTVADEPNLWSITIPCRELS